jgi:hypothetical protein
MCEDPRIQIEGQPSERWRDAITRSCAALSEMRDSDPTSRVRLVPAGDDLIVEVALEDGRSALRRVRDPGQLKSTLDALLTLPPARHTEPAAPPPAIAQAPSANEPVGPNPQRPPPAAPSSSGFEAGMSLGGRMAARTYLSIAPSAYAEARLDQLLLGISVRWDIVQVKNDVDLTDFEMTTVGAGFTVARRFRLDFADVDLGVEPRLLVETQSFRTETGVEDADSKTDLRIAAFSRLAFGHTPLRPFVVLDAELSPGRITRDIRVGPELPVLPSWSAGLGIGLAWSQP